MGLTKSPGPIAARVKVSSEDWLKVPRDSQIAVCVSSRMASLIVWEHPAVVGINVVDIDDRLS